MYGGLYSTLVSTGVLTAVLMAADQKQFLQSFEIISSKNTSEGCECLIDGPGCQTDKLKITIL